MTRFRRPLTILLCAFMGLMLLLYAGHAGRHAPGQHTHPECAVCQVMDGWFSLLKKVFAAISAQAFAISILIAALARPAIFTILRQDITPVTLKVKITS